MNTTGAYTKHGKWATVAAYAAILRIEYGYDPVDAARKSRDDHSDWEKWLGTKDDKDYSTQLAARIAVMSRLRRQ